MARISIIEENDTLYIIDDEQRSDFFGYLKTGNRQEFETWKRGTLPGGFELPDGKVYIRVNGKTFTHEQANKYLGY